jgi:hypothetical protein
MQKLVSTNSITETSIKNDSILMPPPLPPNKSILGGVSSSFNTYLSYKSFNLSKSPIKTRSNTKLPSEDLSQTNSYRYVPFTSYYNQNNSLNCINLRKNLESYKNENLNNIYNDSNKIVLNQKYIEQEQPKNEKDIKEFVNNLLNYINSICNLGFDKYKLRNIIQLKAKIEVRYLDFANQGLKKEYFIDCLMKMQNELIAFICKYNDQLIYDKNGNNRAIINDENKDFFSLF